MHRTSPATLRFLRSAIADRPTPCVAKLQSQHAPRATIRPAVHQSHFSTCRILNQQPGQPLTAESLPKDIPSINKLTHYDFFLASLPTGLPPKGPFTPDLKALRNEFLKLQALAHPDRFPGQANAQSFAQTLSARINEAYKTLQDPLLRAQYLLTLRHEQSSDSGNSASAQAAAEAYQSMDEAASLGEGKGDQELLMEVLELREAIEEAETEEEIENLRVENRGRIEGSVKVLEEAFSADDLGRAGREAVRLRYWVNVEDTLKAWEKGKPVVLVH